MILIFSILFLYRDIRLARDFKGEMGPHSAVPVRSYMSSCYEIQQQCLLLKAGIIDELKTLEEYENEFEKFIISSSVLCAELPKELNAEFSGDASVKSARTIFTRQSTIFELTTDQSLRLSTGARASIRAYMNEHDVAFESLHSHAEEISKSSRVRLSYLSQKPINQVIYPEGQSKKYIINDTKSSIRTQQYLFIY